MKWRASQGSEQSIQPGLVLRLLWQLCHILTGLGRGGMGVGEWWTWKQGPVKKFCSNTNLAQVKVMP